MTRFARLFAILLPVLVCWASPAQAAPLTVKSVVRFSGKAPHQVFTDRLEKTMTAVVQKALAGAPGWEKDVESYQDVLQDVLERAYRGYRVRDMNLSRQQGVVYASATLTPFGDVVGKVRLVADANPMPGLVRAVLVKDLRQVKADLEPVWRGLPVMNESWAGKLMAAQAREVIEAKPEMKAFFAQVQVEVGKVTQVNLTLRARPPVLRDVGVKITSTLLPNSFTDDIRFALTASLAGMRGMPVSLLQRHPDLVSHALGESFRRVGMTRRLKLKASFTSEFGGESLTVRATVGSPRFRLLGGGQLDVGHNLEEGRLDGHAGVVLGKHVEVFVEPAVELSTIKFVSDVGVGLVTFDWLYLAAGRDLTHKVDKWWGRINLSPDWAVTYETRATDGQHREAGLLYRTNDFYTFGLFNDLDDDTWLRLRANL